jgi:putative membrane protein
MKKSILTVLAALSIGFAQAQGMSDADKKFVKEAAEGGMKEVKLGELAQKNGSSGEIRNLGQQMVTDHSKANDELKALASRKGITVPSALTDDAQKEYDRLSKKTGADFDKEYAKCMVKDHKKDVGEFKKEADKGGDSELKAWASKTLPTLEHHLKMSEDAEKAVSGEKKEEKKEKKNEHASK